LAPPASIHSPVHGRAARRPGLPRPGAVIKERTLPHLLPGYLAELNAQGFTEFGPIRLRADGIEVEGQALPWSEVRAIKRSRGWYNVFRRSGWTAWKKAKVSDVPNARVMLELFEQLTGN
jgi:hypothetical protein